jgi:hypothetical protein
VPELERWRNLATNREKVRPRIPEPVRATARRMRREGATVREIASALDISRAGAHNIVRDVEATAIRSCALCGAHFLVDLSGGSGAARYCCHQHKKKAYDFDRTTSPGGGRA